MSTHVVDVDRQRVDDLPPGRCATRSSKFSLSRASTKSALPSMPRPPTAVTQVLGLVARRGRARRPRRSAPRAAARERRLQGVLLLADREVLRVVARHGTVRRCRRGGGSAAGCRPAGAAGALLLEGLLAASRRPRRGSWSCACPRAGPARYALTTALERGAPCTGSRRPRPGGRPRPPVSFFQFLTAILPC